MSAQIISALAAIGSQGGVNSSLPGTLELFVSSAYGANGNDGSLAAPLATAVKAHALLVSIGNVLRNAMAKIICLPGHSESLTSAGALTLSRNDLTLEGLGTGARTPTFTCSGSTAATMVVSGASVSINNIRIVAGIDALVTALSITGADCNITNLITSDNSASINVIDMVSVAATADRLKINGWKHFGASGATGADTALTIIGCDSVEIDNFDLVGDFAVAAIENVTTATTNLKIGLKTANKNHIWTKNAADIAITLVSTATGYIDNLLIRLTDNAANITECVAPGKCNVGREIIVANADGEQGMIINITASTDA